MPVEYHEPYKGSYLTTSIVAKRLQIDRGKVNRLKKQGKTLAEILETYAPKRRKTIK